MSHTLKVLGLGLLVSTLLLLASVIGPVLEVLGETLFWAARWLLRLLGVAGLIALVGFSLFLQFLRLFRLAVGRLGLLSLLGLLLSGLLLGFRR